MWRLISIIPSAAAFLDSRPSEIFHFVPENRVFDTCFKTVSWLFKTDTDGAVSEEDTSQTCQKVLANVVSAWNTYAAPERRISQSNLQNQCDMLGGRVAEATTSIEGMRPIVDLSKGGETQVAGATFICGQLCKDIARRNQKPMVMYVPTSDQLKMHFCKQFGMEPELQLGAYCGMSPAAGGPDSMVMAAPNSRPIVLNRGDIPWPPPAPAPTRREPRGPDSKQLWRAMAMSRQNTAQADDPHGPTDAIKTGAELTEDEFNKDFILHPKSGSMWYNQDPVADFGNLHHWGGMLWGTADLPFEDPPRPKWSMGAPVPPDTALPWMEREEMYARDMGPPFLQEQGDKIKEHAADLQQAANSMSSEAD